MNKVKLNIKTSDGKTILVIDDLKIFDKSKALIFDLEIYENAKVYKDTKFMRITSSKNRLVMS